MTDAREKPGIYEGQPREDGYTWAVGQWWPPHATPDRVRLDVPTPPEPDCAVCGEPIRWCLDMFSYTTGRHELAHARCVWTKPAFREQERQAEDG